MPRQTGGVSFTPQWNFNGDSYQLYNSLDASYHLIQLLLVSGTNIKTVNGNSLLGSGNLVIGGGGGSGTTTNVITFNTTGGASPGVTFDGSSPVTIDHSSIGALALTGGTLTGTLNSMFIDGVVNNPAGFASSFSNTSATGFGLYVQGGVGANAALSVNNQAGTNVLTADGNGNTFTLGRVSPGVVDAQGSPATIFLTANPTTKAIESRTVAQVRSDIGAGTGNGTVTTVTSANSDISVATGTTTPVLTLNNINGFTKNYYDPTSSIQTQLNSKLASSGFTTSAINTLYGYTPANGANYLALSAGSGNPLTGDLYIGTNKNIFLGSGSGNNSFEINSANGSQGLINYYSSGTQKWTTGKQVDDSYIIYNNNTSSYALQIDNTNNKVVTTGLDDYASDLSGSYTARSKVDKAYVDEAVSGVGGLLASNTITAQTTPQTFITQATGGADKVFEVGGFATITSASSVIFNLRVSFTDENNNSQINDMVLNASGNGQFSGGPVVIKAKAGTNIVLSATFTGSCTYNAGAYIKTLF